MSANYYDLLNLGAVFISVRIWLVHIPDILEPYNFALQRYNLPLEFKS